MSESFWDRMSCGRWIGEKWRSAVLDRVPKLWASKNVGKLSSDLWKGPSMSKHMIYYWWWYNENYTNYTKQNDFLLLSWPSDFRLGYHLPICMVIRCRRRKRIWLLHLVQLITVCLYPWKLSSRAMKMREKKNSRLLHSNAQTTGDAHAPSIHARHLRHSKLSARWREPSSDATKRHLANLSRGWPSAERKGGGSASKNHPSALWMGHWTHH